MKKKIIIACTKKWLFKNKSITNFVKKNKVIVFKNKNEININALKKIKPHFIFFPHWNYRVSQQIIEKYNCVCFHTSPLPFGRGGSPIQNLILKKIKKAPVCAIKMTNVLDSGPIYLKKTISLSGTLEEIFIKISAVIIKMIKVMIKKKIVPIKQTGKVFKFKRIKKNQSEIKKEKNITEIYDKIRMLSSDEYPNAFIKKNNIKIFFTKPKIKKNYIYCNAKIFKA